MEEHNFTYPSSVVVHTCLSFYWHLNITKINPTQVNIPYTGVVLMSSKQTADDLPVRNHSHTIHVTGIFSYIDGWLIFVVVN